MLRTISAEWTLWAIASAHAASICWRNPSVSTAVRMSTICRLPSSALASLRRTRSIAAGSTQSLKGGAVAQGTGLASEHRHVVPRVINQPCRHGRMNEGAQRQYGPSWRIMMAIRIGVNFDGTIRQRLAATEYLLLSKRTKQVFETDAGTAWNPSNLPA